MWWYIFLAYLFLRALVKLGRWLDARQEEKDLRRVMRSTAAEMERNRRELDAYEAQFPSYLRRQRAEATRQKSEAEIERERYEEARAFEMALTYTPKRDTSVLERMAV